MATTNPKEKKGVKFNDDISDHHLDENSTNEESDSELDKRQYNKFQFLDLIEGQADENDGEHQAISSENDDDEKITAANNDNKTKSESNKTTNKSSKQKKRRNKNKANRKQQKGMIDSDLDKLIAQVNSLEKIIDFSEKSSDNYDGNKTATKNSHLQLLKLNTKNLIPENELKRMFGRSVFKEDKSRDQKGRHFYPASSSSQRSRFVSSAYHDSRLTQFSSGLKMELDEIFNRKIENNNNGNKKANNKSSEKIEKLGSAVQEDNKPIYFKFVHDKAYQIVHQTFLQAAHLGHSETIVHNLNQYPTHVESLVQLSDMIRISEDYKSASDLIERALYIFERGFHQRFNIALANCRLSYRRPENRTFFITIFKHINYTNRRGLRKTPLEYTKLLLSLDPENDPLFATLLIDFFAIRSEEYDYLIDFYTRWKHLAKLPNMNLSLALAYFMKSRNTKEGKQANENNLKTADDCLQRALIRYPNFIIPLLDACMAEPSSELKKCDYFDYSVYSTKYKTVPESIDLLVSLYVQRSNLLWKTKNVLSWLERNVASLVEQFINKKIVDIGQQIEYWKSFEGPCPRNLLRHVVLSELKVKIPPSASNTTILDIDPYPPESIHSYNIKMGTSETSTTSNNQDSNLTSLGFSSLFLRSMLPSFSMNNDQSTQQSVDTTSQATNRSNPGVVSISGEQSLNVNEIPQPNNNMEADRNRLNLDPVQSSILNVLNSLSNLLSGAENRQENNPDNSEQPRPE